MVNDVPTSYVCHLDQDGCRTDKAQRPELSQAGVELVRYLAVVDMGLGGGGWWWGRAGAGGGGMELVRFLAVVDVGLGGGGWWWGARGGGATIAPGFFAARGVFAGRALATCALKRRSKYFNAANLAKTSKGLGLAVRAGDFW